MGDHSRRRRLLMAFPLSVPLGAGAFSPAARGAFLPTPSAFASSRVTDDPTASQWRPIRRTSPAAMQSTLTSTSVEGGGLEELLDRWYEDSSAIKCPFWRRRAADVIDDCSMLMQFLIIRHKSLPFVSDLLLGGGDDAGRMAAREQRAFTAPGCKPLGRHIKRSADGSVQKTRGLSIGEVEERIRNDWVGGHSRDVGYYITGRLNSMIYRDDCLFSGPDPDMPVKGLRKYLSAASQLFDPRKSSAELLSIKSDEDECVVEVAWRLGGVIMLPWHPTVEPWTGTTRYHVGTDGLIYHHEEAWDISVWRAFAGALYPESRAWPIWE